MSEEKEAITPKKLFDIIDNYKRTPKGNVIIYKQGYQFSEFKQEFIDEVKKELENRLFIVQAGADKLTPLEKLAIFFIDDSY